MINGPSAKIIGFGQADLLTQGVRGEMTVMPNLTASLPMAAALAIGSPAIGAAVWVVDKMVGIKFRKSIVSVIKWLALGSHRKWKNYALV